eukprot:GFKZ01011291.1.p1 GENE.GFKZ01011291.1~~GFKZ01011291.1.p1  ORF type:complete len:301 (-),score=27.72 GFKZ01011291.1:157-939(-)
MSLTFLPVLPNRSSFRYGPRTRIRSPTCTTSLPSDYTQLCSQAATAVQSALASKLTLVEVQFPPLPNMATAALNQLLDANRSFVRSFLLNFTPRYPPDTVIAAFPDTAEAKLAAGVYGKVPFAVAAIPSTPDTPQFVQGPGLIAVVNPGFNINEWIRMESLQGDKPLIAVNADLDKVRGSYYPRLFYPGLWNVKTRFLSRFEPVYYIKQFAGGGTLFRCYPDKWTLFYARGEVVWEGDEKPEFREVERLLRERRMADLKA